MRLDRILYDSEGSSGNTYYVRWVKKASGLIWDDVNKELVADPTWEDSAIILEETGETGAFNVWVPTGIDEETELPLFPPGTYDVIAYKQEGSVPQKEDNIEKQWDSNVGSIFGF